MRNTITRTALISRINRRLRPDDLKLIKLRGRLAEEFGDYVVIVRPNFNDIVGWGRNGPVHSRIEVRVLDLEIYGRQVGALADGEAVAE